MDFRVQEDLRVSSSGSSVVKEGLGLVSKPFVCGRVVDSMENIKVWVLKFDIDITCTPGSTTCETVGVYSTFERAREVQLEKTRELVSELLPFVGEEPPDNIGELNYDQLRDLIEGIDPEEWLGYTVSLPPYYNIQEFTLE